MKSRSPQSQEEVRAFIAGQVEEIRLQLEHLRQTAEAMKTASAAPPAAVPRGAGNAFVREPMRPK